MTFDLLRSNPMEQRPNWTNNHYLTCVFALGLIVASVTADAATVATAPNDPRPHVAYVLDNGMKVILVSDKSIDSAAAALTVQAGRQDDPASGAGRSHLVEHVLLTGGQLQACVRQRGGIRNAERGHTTTQYFFTTENESFERVLKCFARTFAKPRITPKVVERETAAIEAEFRTHRHAAAKELDDAALKLAAHPLHPWSFGFSGNRASLGDDVARLTAEIEAFMADRYTPDQMSLVVVANRSVKQLRKAVRAFGVLQGRQAQRAPKPPLANGGRFVRYRPMDGNARLTMAFALPRAGDRYGEKTHAYVGHRLASDHPGSLFDRLKTRDWIYRAESAIEPVDEASVLSRTVFELTREGADRITEIGTEFFAYVDFLRANDVSAARFGEHGHMARSAFDYDARPSALAYARLLSAHLLTYPIRDAVRAPYAWDQFDPRAIDAVFASMRPDNAWVAFSDPEFSGNSCGFWITFECRQAELPSAWIDAWSMVEPRAFALAAPNPYLPGDFSLVEHASDGVVDRFIGEVRVRRMNEASSTDPRASAFVRIAGDFCLAPQSAAAASVLRELILEAAYRDRKNARDAGYETSIVIDSQGVVVAVDGFRDKLADVVSALTLPIFDLRPGPVEYEAHRRFLIKEAEDLVAGSSKAYRGLQQESLRMMQGANCAMVNHRHAFAKLGLEAFSSWLAQFRMNAVADVFLYGNVNEGDASKIAELLSTHVKAPHRRANSVQLAPVSLTNDRGALVISVPADDASPAAKARLLSIVPLIDSALRQALRENQVAYATGATVRTVLGVPVLQIIAESPTLDARSLEREVIEVLTTLKGQLPRLAPSVFQQLKYVVKERVAATARDRKERGRTLWASLDGAYGQVGWDASITAATRLDRRTILDTYNGLANAVSKEGNVFGAVR
jgi:secreted Zn-dependent insulinase-like peptidase